MSPPSTAPRAVARIDEGACIGCTLCIDACPVDAIVGAAKRMHTVLPALCTGCALCVAPCPVDCIAMVRTERPWSCHDERAAQARSDARDRRRSRSEAVLQRSEGAGADEEERRKRRAAVAAALVRARERRAAAGARTK